MKTARCSNGREIARWLAPFGLMAAISLCSTGPVELPPGLEFKFQDKVIHFLVFGLVATAVMRIPPLRRHPHYAPWVALLVTSLFGMSDEIHQGFVPNRSMDFYDWLTDTLGATVAAFLYRDWAWYRNLLEFGFKKRVKNSAA